MKRSTTVAATVQIRLFLHRSQRLAGRCENPGCAHTSIAFNSCRNRHCPKCQGSQARAWMEARKAELLAAPYFHVVFTLPPRIGAIAYQNKAVIYDLLFKASAETLLMIAADPKRLGVKIGFTSVLHTWGSAMAHHPHVHMIVRPCGAWLRHDAAASRRTDRAGSAARRIICCRCRCCRGCSVARCLAC